MTTDESSIMNCLDRLGNVHILVQEVSLLQLLIEINMDDNGYFFVQNICNHRVISSITNHVTECICNLYKVLMLNDNM